MSRFSYRQALADCVMNHSSSFISHRSDTATCPLQLCSACSWPGLAVCLHLCWSAVCEPGLASQCVLNGTERNYTALTSLFRIQHGPRFFHRLTTWFCMLASLCLSQFNASALHLQPCLRRTERKQSSTDNMTHRHVYHLLQELHIYDYRSIFRVWPSGFITSDCRQQTSVISTWFCQNTSLRLCFGFSLLQ